MADLLTVFKALSDETRLKVIKLLEHGELCVCDITAALDMSQSKVSFHLGVLKNASLVKSRKEGKWMHYTINDSDYFNRLLTLSIIQELPEETLKNDRDRLEAFLKNKDSDQPAAKNCCSKRSA
jgi:ArsR family transcriptional regulator, arsenate/arsenite/antimonite-responsive transcriptional repressor